jgi:hypothetical protein
MDMTSNQAKVLILSPFAIAPAKNGGTEKSVATYANLASVADVIVIWPENHPGYGLARLPGGCLQLSIGLEPEVSAAISHDRTLWGSKGWSAALGKHIGTSNTFNSAIADFARNVDIIILSHCWLIDVIPESFTGRVIFDSFGSEEELLSSQLFAGDNSLLDLAIKAMNQELIAVTKQLEQKSIIRSNLVLAMTQDEADSVLKFRKEASVGINVCGVDIPANFVTRKSRSGPFLFFGSAHPPNVFAANWIVEFAKTREDLNFVIAGSVARFVEEKSANLRLIPDVADSKISSLIDSCFAFLNPISSGSGVSLKTLRVLAGGLPLISTPLGVRGLALRPGKDVLVQDLDGIEVAIDELLASPELQSSLCVAGRNYASRNHNWAEISLKFALAILGDKNKLSTFDYIPVKNFSEYNSLVWLNQNSIEFIKIREILPTLSTSFWLGHLKPVLRKYTPAIVRKLVKTVLLRFR